MNMIADGVNGLLSMRRDSFVVCAFKILDASERMARGLGEFSMGERGGGGDWRADWKRCRKVVRFEIVVCNVTRASVSLNGAIVGTLVIELDENTHLISKVG